MTMAIIGLINPSPLPTHFSFFPRPSFEISFTVSKMKVHLGMRIETLQEGCILVKDTYIKLKAVGCSQIYCNYLLVDYTA